MSAIKDETGKKYANLTVISFAGVSGRYATFLCKCDCGRETVVRGSDLRTGNTKSCGKCKTERHGMCRSRLYNIWIHIKRRTNNPNAQFYEDYGGRGIKICDEWNKSFLSFKTITPFTLYNLFSNLFIRFLLRFNNGSTTRLIIVDKR